MKRKHAGFVAAFASVAALALPAAWAGAALPAPNASSPSETTPLVVAPVPGPAASTVTPLTASPPGPYSDARLAGLMEDVQEGDDACPGGCGLVHILKTYGVRPHLLTPRQLDKLMPGQGKNIVAQQFGTSMFLNGEAGDAQLLEAFAHESRHLWQYRGLGAFDGQLEPRRALILNRVREADAFAYAIYFTYNLERVKGWGMVDIPADTTAPMHPYTRMYVQFRDAMNAGVPIDAAYRALVSNCLAFVHRMDYDGDVLDGFEEAAKSANKAGKTQPLLTVSNVEFLEMLRAMGKPGFAVTGMDAGKGFFDDLSQAQLLDVANTGGITHKNLLRLENLEKPAVPAKAAKPEKTTRVRGASR
jgi:hypothetical protein